MVKVHFYLLYNIQMLLINFPFGIPTIYSSFEANIHTFRQFIDRLDTALVMTATEVIYINFEVTLNKCDESPIEPTAFLCYIYVSQCDQAVYRSVALSRHAQKVNSKVRVLVYG